MMKMEMIVRAQMAHLVQVTDNGGDDTENSDKGSGHADGDNSEDEDSSNDDDLRDDAVPPTNPSILKSP